MSQKKRSNFYTCLYSSNKKYIAQYEHNNNKSKHGTFKNRRGSGSAIWLLQDEGIVEKKRKQKKEKCIKQKMFRPHPFFNLKS